MFDRKVKRSLRFARWYAQHHFVVYEEHYAVAISDAQALFSHHDAGKGLDQVLGEFPTVDLAAMLRRELR